MTSTPREVIAREIACGYFVGKTTPAGCRGVLHYARRLAQALHDKHYPDVAFEPSTTLTGLLLQIDNMTSALVHEDAHKEQSDG